MRECRDTRRLDVYTSSSMPKGGLEPPRVCTHWLLKPARLPVPPLRPDLGVQGAYNRRSEAPQATLCLTLRNPFSILKLAHVHPIRAFGRVRPDAGPKPKGPP